MALHTLLYDREVWTITNSDCKGIQPAELKYLHSVGNIYTCVIYINTLRNGKCSDDISMKLSRPILLIIEKNNGVPRQKGRPCK